MHDRGRSEGIDLIARALRPHLGRQRDHDELKPRERGGRAIAVRADVAVPDDVAEDYVEACNVLPDSLKASAALSFSSESW